MSLFSAKVEDASLVPLARLGQLRSLVWTPSKSGDRLVGVATLKQVHFLNLKYGNFGDRGLQDLAGMTQLRALDLGGCQNITNDGLAVLGNFKSLEALDLSGTNITDPGMKHVAKLRELRQLGLGISGLVDFKGDGLRDLTGLRKLQDLTLPVGTTDAGLKTIGSMTQLQSLRLSGISQQITDAGARELAGLSELRTLISASTA